MIAFIGTVLVIIVAVLAGAKFHEPINAKLNKLVYGTDELPPDFKSWLSFHKGEYPNIGAAMAAWADAKYGSKFDNLLK